MELEVELMACDEDDILACEIPDFLYKSEEKKETALRKELNLENNIDNTQDYDPITEIYDITVRYIFIFKWICLFNDIFKFRNLMKDSIDEILKTFSDHEDQLKRIYGEEIKQFVSCISNTFTVI